MFNPTTEQLWQEVQAAVDVTEQHTEAVKDIIRRFTGRFYRRDNEDLDADPENFVFGYVSNLLPLMGSDDPKVDVKAARIIGHRTVSQAIEDGINAWIRDEGYAGITEPVHLDYLLLRGVLMVYLEEDQRFSRGIVKPAVKRIDPKRFFIDSLADDTISDEFRGHWYYADLDELAMDPNVNRQALEMLKPGDGDASQDAKEPWPKRANSTELGRRRVKCYNVWIRSTNTLRVLAQGSQAVELYPPRPFYGPPDGPYVLYDAYPVPGMTWPLTTVVAVQDQSLDLNIHARAMGRAAARRKTLVLVEANNPDLGDKLTDAEDGEILPVKGITGNHVVIEMPGVTQEQYTTTEYLRNRLDRISGLTATIQGSVGVAETATEAQIAATAMDQRVSYLRRRVKIAHQQALSKVGWFLFHTEGIVIPVNRRDPYTGELFEGLFFGGPSPTDQGATWDDFDLSIRLNTMQQELTARQDMLGYFQIFLQSMQLAPVMPHVRWMSVLRDLAEVFRVGQHIPDEWCIPELFGAFTQPPQLPPSQFIGARPTPPRGAPSGIGAPRLDLANGTGPQLGAQGLFSGNAGGLGRTGLATGPRVSRGVEVGS